MSCEMLTTYFEVHTLNVHDAVLLRYQQAYAESDSGYLEGGVLVNNSVYQRARWALL